MDGFPRSRRVTGVSLAALIAVLGGVAAGLFGVCGPFTDVSDAAFCPFVLEVFTLGITTGTSPTTYDPTSAVSRLQMAAFLSRSVDGVLKRGGPRAALKQFWTSKNPQVLGLTTVGTGPINVESDGTDIWVSNRTGNTISRVKGSDGTLLGTWTGAVEPYGILVAMGRVFFTGQTFPGKLYRINPSQAPGVVTTLATNLGNESVGIAFDGERIWTSNTSSVSIVTPGATTPWTVTTVSTGFENPYGALYDGANIWVTDYAAGSVLKLASNGAILTTVTVGGGPYLPVFDGANIWVPSRNSGVVSVIRASNGALLATLTGNGLSAPAAAAFDGQRVLVTDQGATSRVTLWKAADLTPLGFFSLSAAASQPGGACSDGVSFWIALNLPGQIARF